MRRTASTVIVAASFLAAAVSPALGARTEITPGITYERVVKGGQVIHITRVNRSPLITAQPTNFGRPRGLLSTAVRARTTSGAVAAVNGDFFNWTTGIPSGLFLENGRLVNEPEATRSALVFSQDGWMAALQTSVEGTWQAAPTSTDPAPAQYGFKNANRPADRDTSDRTILYTSDFGGPTPRGTKTEALIRLDPPGVVIPNRSISGTVQTVRPGGGIGIAKGFVVISGSGAGPSGRIASLAPGRRITFDAGLPNIPDTAYSAMGGGPVLVVDGKPVMNGDANGFDPGQVRGRSARTAIGQTATGQLLLVVSEGPGEGSPGMTANEQAELMASLGTRTAIAMDSGGSSGMVVRGRLVNRVAAGERAISSGLIISYAGVQLTEPAPLVTPNGDRLDDTSTIVARSVKEGSANIVLRRPGRKAIRLLYRGPLGPDGTSIPVGQGKPVPPGVYDVVAQLTPADGSTPTEHRRRLVIDDTLGSLSVRRTGSGKHQTLRTRFKLQHGARVTVQAVNARGKVVRTLARSRHLRPGWQTLNWNMHLGKRPLPAGAYTMRVTLRTGYRAPNQLTARFVALRAGGAKR